MTTDELNIVIRALGTQQFRSQMSQCTISSLKFKAAVTGITIATKKFISSAIELASDLEEVQNVVRVTFGDMEESVNSFAKNAITQFGLSETYAKKYAGTFGAMAKSFGFNTEQAMKMSTTLTGLTGDVASFYNLDSDVAYTKLKSVFTGETESLKDLGIVMTQTALDQYALEKGLGKTTKEMNEQEKVALRYQFIMEKLKGASGDYARTSHEWANSFRTAKLQIQSMVAEVGAELMPAAKIVLSYTVQGLKYVLGFLKSVATGISYVTRGWQAASTATKTLIVVTTGAAIAFLNFNKVMAVTKTLVTLLTASLSPLQAVLTVLGLIAGAVGAVALVSSISDVFNNLEDSLKNSTDSLSNVNANMADMNAEFDSGADSVSDYSDSVKELEKSLMSFDEVNKMGDNSLLGDIVSDDALGNFEQFTDTLNGLYDNMSFDMNLDGLDGMSDAFDSINQKINDTFGGLMDKVSQTKVLWDEMINADSFEEGLESANEIVRVWFGDDWVEFWEDCGATALEVFEQKKWRDKVSAVDKLVRRRFGGTVWYGFWNRSWGLVSDAWKVFFDLISGDIPNLMQDLESLFTKIKNIYSFWKSVFTGDIGGAINAMLGSTLDIYIDNSPVEYAGPTLSGAAGYTVGGYSKGGGATHKFAAGGFPDTGEMFIARESGPEMVGRIGNKTAVANNEQITTAIYNAVKSALGNGGNRQGTTVLYLDGKVLGKSTVDYINNQTRSVGQSPLVEIG